jgi:hypothetical protein
MEADRDEHKISAGKPEENKYYVRASWWDLLLNA